MPTTLQFNANFRPSYGPLYQGIPFNDVAAFSQLYRAKSATRVRLIILLTESDNQFEKKMNLNFHKILEQFLVCLFDILARLWLLKKFLKVPDLYLVSELVV